MTSFEDTREYQLGHTAEVAWCRYLAGRGNVVVPVYGAKDVDERTKAPVVFRQGQVGLGQYLRGSHELCLFATRGKTHLPKVAPPLEEARHG